MIAEVGHFMQSVSGAFHLLVVGRLISRCEIQASDDDAASDSRSLFHSIDVHRLSVTVSFAFLFHSRKQIRRICVTSLLLLFVAKQQKEDEDKYIWLLTFFSRRRHRHFSWCFCLPNTLFGRNNRNNCAGRRVPLLREGKSTNSATVFIGILLGPF